LLEILGSIFGAIFDLAHQPKLRDRSEAKWFHYPLAIGYYSLPTLLTAADDLWAQ
jgi:hypothetical protein